MSPETKALIGQVFSIVATVITIFSYQCRSKNKIVGMQILSTICLATSYCLLGASQGFYLNIVGSIRNICLFFQPKTGRIRYYSGVFFATATLVVGLIFFESPIDLLMIIALVINSYALSAFSAQALRYSILLTSALITVYAILFVNVGAICNETLSIASAAVGILRYRTVKKEDSATT